MQNRYACDVGDFGKLGMLRCLEREKVSIAVNWYLVEDESHNDDGKHIGYLKDKMFRGCDDELLYVLASIVAEDKRSVHELETREILSEGNFYSDILHDSTQREQWHKNAMKTLKGCDFVFLDPDNGLIPPSVGRTSNRSVKYVLPKEIIDYYNNGHSVIFYNHRTREKLDKYLRRFDELFKSMELKDAQIKAISYKRGTVRDYFFVLHEEHVNVVERVLKQLTMDNWEKHFQMII